MPQRVVDKIETIDPVLSPCLVFRFAVVVSATTTISLRLKVRDGVYFTSHFLSHTYPDGNTTAPIDHNM